MSALVMMRSEQLRQQNRHLRFGRSYGTFVLPRRALLPKGTGKHHTFSATPAQG